jgi:hypothetical protein
MKKSFGNNIHIEKELVGIAKLRAKQPSNSCHRQILALSTYQTLFQL